MAEAPEASTISPLNILFEDLQEEMDASDVMKMKRLLRGKQLSKEEMDKLESASDVFHHLKDRGHLGERNLNLLLQLFENLHKEPLKNKVVEFQRAHVSTTDPLDNRSTSVSNRGKDWNKTSSEAYNQNLNKTSKKRWLKNCRKEQRDEGPHPVKKRKTGPCLIKAGKTGKQSSSYKRCKVQKIVRSAKLMNLKKRKAAESNSFQLPKEERFSEGGQNSSDLHVQKKCNLTNLTAKVAVEIDEEERESRKLDLKERRIELEERELNLKLKKQLVEYLENCIKEKKTNAMFDKCVELFKACRADKSEVKLGSIFFILSFLTEEDIDYFWQKYKEGTVDKALTRILIPPYIRDKAEKAGITFRIRLEIDEKEYEEVKKKIHETEMSAVSSSSRATRRQVQACGTNQWEAFVMDQVQDKQQAKNLLEQSKFDPVVNTLRQDEFFYPSLVSFWFENSYTLPTTVTKATEYAVIHHAEMYCKENNVEIENLREILKARFNDIGKCLYDHITAENVGKLFLEWIDKSIQNLESYFFGLLTKSEDCYTFQSKYVYGYIIATYLSNIVALSPNNIPMFLREEKTKILQANMSYCSPYVTGILGEKASYFLKEFVKFSEIQTPLDINNLGLLGNCLFESERPSVFARDIEEVIGQNYTLDLSTCTRISNQSIHALAVILQYTSLIKDIKLYSESDEAFLSNEFKESLTNIIGDPLSLDRCTVRIDNTHDFIVTTKLLRALPLLQKHAKSISGSDTTQQPAVTSLTISSNESIMEVIEECTMQMFMKALSFMPHLEKLSLTGLGSNLCEQFLLCLSEQTVSLNVNTLCLAENELSWNHCRLLREVLNAVPRLTVLDLSKNSIGSLGCTVLLPIREQIDVRVDDNNIVNGLLELLPLCTSTAQQQDVGDLTLKTLDDVVNLIRSLDNVKHIDCTKLITSQLSKLCKNLSLLSNTVSIDLSGTELNQHIVLLLSERLKHLKELKKVDLGHCCVSRDDMQVLLQHISQEVIHLNLSNIDMSGHLLTKLKRFRNLKYLNLSNSNLKANDHIFRFFPTSVTHLNLSQNELYELNSENLENITQLEELDLSYNKLSHIDISEGDFSLKHLTKLQRLDLSHNNLQLPLHSLLLNVSETLKYLDVSFNKIENVDQVGKLISEFSQLWSINMNSNQIGAVGVQTLLSEIQSYDAKCDIDVSHNVFGLQKIIPYIANQLPVSTVIPDLERENLTIKDEHLQVFFKNISKITSVEIPKNVEWSETDYKNVLNDLAVFSNIERLTLAWLNPTTCPFLAKSLRNFSCLRRLDISGSKIDSEGVKVVVHNLLSLKRLAYVNLSNTNIGMLDIEFIQDIQRQHFCQPFINVAHNFQYLPAIFPYIKDQLRGSSIEDIDFDSDELPVQSFPFLQITKLKKLTVKEKHWVDKEFKCFVQGLNYLYPEYLDLSHSNIGDFGTVSLSEVIGSRHGLTHLVLSHNKIGNSGAMGLSEGMRSMYGLTHLDLSHNNIGDSGAKSLREVMRSMRRLTYLDLSHNNIGDSGAQSLSEVIRSMRRLTYLDLSHHNIGDSGAESLSEVIRSMRRLTYLDLSHNNIGDSGADSLSEGMRSMRRLTHLDLSHNNIGDFGAYILRRVMQPMRRLTHLDLSHNKKNTTQYSEGISSMTSFEKSKAASEKENATYKSAKSSISYSQEEQHSKEMSYHRAQHKEQTLLPSSPQPSTSGYRPPTEKDPSKS